MLPFPASPRWSPLQWELSLSSGESKNPLGKKTAEGELDTHPSGSGQTHLVRVRVIPHPPIYSFVVGSRSSCEGEHRVFVTCCGTPGPRGDGMLVGGTFTDPESQLKSLLFPGVSNPVGNLLVLLSFAASYGHYFQTFATSHALISVLNWSPQVSLSTLWD